MERLFAFQIFARRPKAAIVDFLHDARPWVYRLALAVVGSPDLAEDIAQESIVRAWRAQGTLAHVEDMRAWLRRVVVRQAITALGKRKTVELIEAPVPNAEESIHVRAVLAGLPTDVRVILALTYFEGLSYAELAQTLEVPEGTVASRLHAARAAFRSAWEGR